MGQVLRGLGCCELLANNLLEVLSAPPSRAIGYSMERLLGSCPVTAPHDVWRKLCGNGEGGTRYPTVPMHKVTKFGDIRTKFLQISYEFTRFSPWCEWTLHSQLPRNWYEFHATLSLFGMNDCTACFYYEMLIDFTLQKIQLACKPGLNQISWHHNTAATREQGGICESRKRNL